MDTQRYHDENSEEDELKKLLSELKSESSSPDTEADDASAHETDEINISPEETERALRRVHSELGFEPDNSASDSTPFHFFRAFAAAALLLIVFAAGYFLIPVNHQAPLGDTMVVNLPDGSSADLNSGSELTYNRLFGRFNRDVSLNGEAYFRVQTNDLPFKVEANGSVTEVTGTEFNIRSWSSDPGMPTRISVTDGEVYFYGSDRANDRVRLSKGLSSQWLPGQLSPDEPESTDERTVLAWRDQNLAFSGQQLVVIFNELERKFNTRIEIENIRIATEVLTTFYSQPDNLESLLDDITTVKGLNYRETANGFYVFRE